MDYPWEEDIPYRIRGPKVGRTQQSTSILSRNRVSGLRNVTLSTYNHHIGHLDYCGRKMFPKQFGIQKSSTLDIEVAIWFLGFRTLPFLPRVTISHMYIYGHNGLSIEQRRYLLSLRSEGERPSALDIKVPIWFSFQVFLQ
jgi:hypothetical protein